jgi:hypothetical protein
VEAHPPQRDGQAKGLIISRFDTCLDHSSRTGVLIWWLLPSLTCQRLVGQLNHGIRAARGWRGDVGYLRRLLGTVGCV